VEVLESGMAKRRKATPVTLTPGQRQRLERLWFIYGNYGPKTTPGNHGFIQGLLEQGLDLRPLITKRSRKSEIPTPECEAAVDEVLARRDTDEDEDGPGVFGELRVVSNAPEPERPAADAEFKAMLDGMKRRRRDAGRRLPGGGETPDAA